MAEAQVEEQQTSQSPRVVLFPVDRSKHSEAAFDWYCDNIYRYQEGRKDKVIIVHCTELHPPALPHAIATEEWRQEVEKHQQKINELEEKYIKKLKGLEKLNGKKIIIEGGPVGEKIVKVARKENAALIVMGSRGMGRLRRTILGSVSSYVTHHADIPVVIVPSKH